MCSAVNVAVAVVAVAVVAVAWWERTCHRWDVLGWRPTTDGETPRWSKHHKI